MCSNKIKIYANPVVMDAELNDSRTAQMLRDVLPVEAQANIWGDEIYFSIPLNADVENPQEVVELGDLGYWPPGAAFCIFFGPTPMSIADEIRPASAVNVIGRLSGDAKAFKQVKSGTTVRIEKYFE